MPSYTETSSYILTKTFVTFDGDRVARVIEGRHRQINRSTLRLLSFRHIEAIVEHYEKVCRDCFVDPNLAVAQLCHETAFLTSWWFLRNNNPAGIGVTGETSTSLPQPSVNIIVFNTSPPTKVTVPTWAYDDEARVWRKGLVFLTIEDAIVAHIGRLVAYALAQSERTPMQESYVSLALRFRDLPVKAHGSAKTLAALGRARNPNGYGWASPGEHYGKRIADIAQMF